MQRLKRLGVIPVEQMPAVARHVLNRRHRHFDAIDGVSQADPAEIARGDNRQQVDADIGWRGARCHDRSRAFLEIVRRQVGVVGGKGNLQIGPGSAARQKT